MRTWTLLAACAFSAVASADRMETQLVIPGWKIESNECLFVGKRHSSYPLLNLVDQNPWTTWVHSGLNYPKMPKEERFGLDDGPLRLTFEPRNPIEIDELRLMNGYNKSEELYLKNSRITEVKIYSGDVYASSKIKPIRTVQLDEEMGFRSIKLPRRKYEKITVVFSEITKGESDDLCVSEVMFRNAGKNLIQRPNAYFASDGADCGCDGTIDLFNTSGKKMGETSTMMNLASLFSPDGKKVVVYEPTSKLLKLIDLFAGRTVSKSKVADFEWSQDVSWKSNTKVVVDFGEGQRRTLSEPKITISNQNK